MGGRISSSRREGTSVDKAEGTSVDKAPNVKLQAQQIPTFSGQGTDWRSWKKKARSAVGTMGMLKVLEDKMYAEDHPAHNETVFHLLQVATADIDASHLVDYVEEERNGYAAWSNMEEWYDGYALTTEMAEDVRAKMDKLRLGTDSTASQYVNSFRSLVKKLRDLNESYTDSKTIDIFLTQITDPEYDQTIERLRETWMGMEECINAIRMKDRRIARGEQKDERLSNLLHHVVHHRTLNLEGRVQS